MKLPDPVGYQWLNTAHYRRKLPIGANVNEFKKLYTAVLNHVQSH